MMQGKGFRKFRGGGGGLFIADYFFPQQLSAGKFFPLARLSKESYGRKSNFMSTMEIRLLCRLDLQKSIFHI